MAWTAITNFAQCLSGMTSVGLNPGLTSPTVDASGIDNDYGHQEQRFDDREDPGGTPAESKGERHRQGNRYHERDRHRPTFLSSDLPCSHPIQARGGIRKDHGPRAPPIDGGRPTGPSRAPLEGFAASPSIKSRVRSQPRLEQLAGGADVAEVIDGHAKRVDIEGIERLGARQTLVSPLALDPLINIEATIPSGSMPQYPT